MEQGIITAALILAVSAALVFLSAGFIRRRRRERFVPMDELEGHEFEFYCAELLRADGFSRVTVTRGSGDFGADILAEKDGVTYAVQCKCYSGPCGVSAVQEAAAGRDFYERMVGAVMTNSYYTRGAETAAGKLRILLWDRDHMEELERQSTSYYQAGCRREADNGQTGSEAVD
ncbi:restriction endonuclease [Lachnoclostridium sp. Marseille-P6806]|uniref:restriction endonuclease n=1 Tax=Lachnoclostridium sp. Marseille-P6806 TaxID=2364793 RepID=UPI00103024B3|nr:restriction endonuclease [Lachnoclostridium sp. Marseille-P6806]